MTFNTVRLHTYPLVNWVKQFLGITQFKEKKGSVVANGV